MDDLGTAECQWHAARSMRRQLDLAIGRAMIDEAYARQLLTDPLLAVSEVDCTPAQRRSLSTLSSPSIPDLAAAFVCHFWGVAAAQAPETLQLAEVS